jgi:2-polyprenyl-3-methyl-5-hydroxy-6-metoxy-1,4-benzoquinol methylase
MTALAQNEDPTRPRSARTKEQIERDLNFVLKTEPSGELDASNEEALSSLGSLIGLKVAEAGAGQGYIVEKLARRVGSSGLVYAEDIRADGRWRRGRNI